ncbi:hypothetical protein JCM11641_006248 [Rhodosporidiobolus odoratus]
MPQATPIVPARRSFRVQLANSDEDYQRCLAVRVAVFVDEQGFSMEDEIDDKDETSDHLLLVATNEDGSEEDAGTIRWWPKPDTSPSAGKLGRLAVNKKFRGDKFGKELILRLRSTSGRGRFGYVAQGEKFLEDGADHIKLTKTFQLVPESP